MVCLKFKKNFLLKNFQFFLIFFLFVLILVAFPSTIEEEIKKDFPEGTVGNAILGLRSFWRFVCFVKNSEKVSSAF